MVAPVNSRRLLGAVLVILTLFVVAATSHRPKNAPSSDSILEIINTQEVERMLAARRLNNALDEDFQDTDPQVITYEPPDPPSSPSDYEENRGRRGRNHRRYSGNSNNNNNNNRISVELPMKQYNDTDQHTPGAQTQEELSELAAYQGLKLLKSSKKALVVTKKEYLKRDWCKTEPLMQRVKEDGCVSKTVVNKFCYGQCNSFYIPKNPRRRRGRPGAAPVRERDDMDQNGAAFKSCAFCRPKKFSWVTVTLRCPNLVPPYRKKRIQRIKQCKCTAADVN